MKNLLLLITLLLIQSIVFAQTDNNSSVPPNEQKLNTIQIEQDTRDIERVEILTDDTPPPVIEEESTVFIFVEQNPEFPGGQDAMMKYLSSNSIYPQEAVNAGITGKVFLKFVVERDGKISGVEVMRGVHPLLDKEALRVVKSMPNFIPGKQNGKAVRVQYTLPVNFYLK